jgi:hypothetical protein
VTPATVAEQIIYEIGDPAHYLLPDVTCDFSQVQMSRWPGPGARQRVHAARPHLARYKVCATYNDGWRLLGTLMIGGAEAARKARRVGQSILQRCSGCWPSEACLHFTETSLEVLGAESTYGPQCSPRKQS